MARIGSTINWPNGRGHLCISFDERSSAERVAVTYGREHDDVYIVRFKFRKNDREYYPETMDRASVWLSERNWSIDFSDEAAQTILNISASLPQEAAKMIVLREMLKEFAKQPELFQEFLRRTEDAKFQQGENSVRERLEDLIFPKGITCSRCEH
jgi:hypothetical protein